MQFSLLFLENLKADLSVDRLSKNAFHWDVSWTGRMIAKYSCLIQSDTCIGLSVMLALTTGNKSAVRLELKPGGTVSGLWEPKKKEDKMFFSLGCISAGNCHQVPMQGPQAF